MTTDIELQRAYYARTASEYDAMHAAETHPLALATLTSAIEMLGAKSLLDIGSGTGRVVEHVRRRHAGMRAVGIEPVGALRAVGHANGVPRDCLIDGDATRLPYRDRSFDVVSAFAVLHHIPHPDEAVSEMLRIADKAIFIADANNFGQGRPLTRAVKQILGALHLWPLANLVKTGGKGYMYSEGDGVAYSYSVFRNYRQVAHQCRQLHVMNLDGDGRCAYRSAGFVALLGVK